MTSSRTLLFVLPCGLMALAVACSTVGPTSISPADLAGALCGGSSLSPTQQTIYWQFRLPRVVAACIVGAALAAAGVGFQGLFRNPLAEPYIIGASSGAALGVSIAVVAGFKSGWLGFGATEFCALVGAVSTVATVFAIGSCSIRASSMSLLLAGVAISSMVSGIVSLLMYANDEKAVVIISWLMGSLADSRWESTVPTGVLAVVGIAIVWLLARPLDAFSLGDVASRSLGIHLTRFRLALIAGASLATAAAVAGAGIIGFVGLVAPHIARRVCGERHAVLVPVSAVFGAALMLVADAVARTVLAPAELPIGVVTSMLGCPFFLSLLLADPGRRGC
jgi:iron complex transport system permease protein